MNSIFKKIALPVLPLIVVFFIGGCADDNVAGNYAKPDVGAVSPEQALIGSQVTLTGTGFTKVSRVDFASVQSNFSIVDDKTITATVPDGLQAGEIKIALYYSGASETNLGASDDIAFTVLYPPAISQLSVSEAKPTKDVLITGSYLKDATAVKFGDAAASFEATATTIKTKVPDINTAGSVQLSITTPGGTVSVPFKVLAKTPEIESLTPVEGKTGEQITVKGLFFTDVQSVSVNGTAVATYTVVSPTELKLTIPAGATTGKIKVTTSIGSVESSTNLKVIVTLTLPYNVYTDELNAAWEKWGGWGTSDQVVGSTDQPKTGTKSIKVSYSDAYGGFQLHPKTPAPFVIEAVTKIKLSIYTGAAFDGKQVALYIKNAAGTSGTQVPLTLVGGAYTTFEVTKAQLGNLSDISEFVLQNWGTANITVYVDDVILQ
jgi:hypothetical protein